MYDIETLKLFAQFGMGGLIAGAMIILHWMTLKRFTKDAVEERLRFTLETAKERERIAAETAKERELQRAESAQERSLYREQLIAERANNQSMWEQFVTLKLQHHTEVMAVLAQHGQVLAELRMLAQSGGLCVLASAKNREKLSKEYKEGGSE